MSGESKYNVLVLGVINNKKVAGYFKLIVSQLSLRQLLWCCMLALWDLINVVLCYVRHFHHHRSFINFIIFQHVSYEL